MRVNGKTYPHVYSMLKQAGHTPDKAAEIILDAGRKDQIALLWILAIYLLDKRARTK